MERMDYKGFKHALTEKLNEFCGQDKKVEFHKALKTNIGEVEALSIVERKPDGSRLTPSHYIPVLYKEYTEGAGLEEIVGMVIASYYKCLEEQADKFGCLNCLNDFEQAKELIYYCIINTERNTGFLEDKPHMEIHDLSMVFYLMLVSADDSVNSICITNMMLNNWKVSPEKIRACAVENTEKLFPWKRDSLLALVSNMMREGVPKDEASGVDEAAISGTPFVITNEKNINGFGAVFYEGKLRELAEETDSNLFILPSSLHEALVFPETGEISAGDFLKTVKNVNATAVKPQDFLSDNIYLYDRECDELRIIREGGEPNV